jgi:HPt (histidine-containing phosphotransfer) domain-containing protein
VTVVAGDHVRIRGGVGLPAAVDGLREIPLSRSFTSLIVADGRPLILDDVRTDARVRNATSVAAHDVVALAAMPLVTAGGTTLGAFCAMDRRPHRWPAEETALLEELARIATRMIEMEQLIERMDQELPVGVARVTHPPVSSAAAPAPDDANVTVDDDIVDLVPGYVAAQRKNVTTLQDLLERGDFKGIRQQGHKMKGSGAGYGLPGVTRVGSQLEMAAAHGDSESVRKSLADLQEYLTRLNIRSADGRMVVGS